MSNLIKRSNLINVFKNLQILLGILLAWIILISAIQPSILNIENNSIFDLQLPTLNNEMVDMGSLANKRAIVLVFLSPECPLCKNYTVTLNELLKTYEDKNVALFGIIPGKNYSTSEIEKYNRKYKLKFKLLLDEKYEMSTMLNAKVTPEAFLLNNKGEIIYSGKIDNWAVSLKRKRQIITEHYLTNALSASLNGLPVELERTEPVGCIIDM